MEIRIGQTYKNRTYAYLRPSLALFGPLFITKFNTFFRLAYGLHDAYLDGTPIELERTVFILLDLSVSPSISENSLDWMRNQDFYVVDYPYTKYGGRLQMLVLRFHEKQADIYDKFLESKYSYMYTRGELEQFYPNFTPARAVLTKHYTAKEDFKVKVHKSFGTVLEDKDLKGEGVQFDFPWNKKEEYFNYN